MKSLVTGLSAEVPRAGRFAVTGNPPARGASAGKLSYARRFGGQALLREALRRASSPTRGASAGKQETVLSLQPIFPTLRKTKFNRTQRILDF